MASSEILDFAALLEPIPGENPVGADLREDRSPNSAYYRVKDARSAARAAERQLVGGEEGPAIEVNWRPILKEAPEVLAKKSKDLEIAAYLVEALVREHGFAGLRDGLRLCREFAERFWDGLYPLPDEEGLSTRVAPLTGLNGEGADGTLMAPIANIPLTNGTSAGPFGYSHYQQASKLASMANADARQQRIEEGAVPMELVEKTATETSADFFRNLAEDIDQSSEEFARLCDTLQEKCGASAPPASNIRNALRTCREAVQVLAKDKLPSASRAEEAAGPAQASSQNGPRDSAIGVIRTRDDAFRTLLQVAEFFRRTEPHTPLSYSLEQIVRWGRMPLPQLLEELITDEGTRSQLYRQLGIKMPE